MKYLSVLVALSVLGSTESFALSHSEESVTLHGKVLDLRTHFSVNRNVTIDFYCNNDFIKEDSINTTHGEFTIPLRKFGWYLISLSAPGYSETTDTLWVLNENKRIIDHDFYISPTEQVVDASISPGNIYFDFGESRLSRHAFPELEKAIQYFTENPDLNIEIAGYTDSHGAKDYNVLVSRMRASAVADYLVSRGVNLSRLKIAGYGDANPIDRSGTPEGEARNRRVEFVLSNPQLQASVQTAESRISEAKSTVYFGFNKTQVSTQFIPELDDVVSYFKENPAANIEVTGYTDARGSEKCNLLVSKLRAQAVANYLVEHGVNKMQLKVVGLGETNLLDTSGTREGDAKNRRVEIKFFNGQSVALGK